jgi:pimeloyl-ACP methyl ester carboxylesterase
VTTRIFIHGLESSSQGTKGVFFREKFPDMIIPDFKGGLPERMDKLKDILSGKSGIRLVGSSFGGLMGAIFSIENASLVDRLILLAPALNLMEFVDYCERRVSTPAWIYHGTSDEVIPLEVVKRVAKETFLNLSFNAVDDDHFLHKTFKTIHWDELLA